MKKKGRLLREVKHFAQVKKDKDEHQDAMLEGLYFTLVPDPEPGCEINEISAQEILDEV